MSYAIIRNIKLTRDKAKGSHRHGERKSKNYSNKDIDPSRTHLNYHIKKPTLTYIKEFDKLKKETNIKGQIRKNSNILCEMVFTSDNEFFKSIGEKESKRYFQECYNFVTKFKNLGEQNIISAVIHLDETSPHMHLIFSPVLKIKDKEGNTINKLSCRDFWLGRDSYRILQNKFHEHVTSKGFKLERGIAVEETGREHYSVEKYKHITNFENTKKVLSDVNLEIPPTPEIKDIKKIVLNRDERIQKEIIQPRDKLIKDLHKDNISLKKELFKQVHLVEVATQFDKERDSLLSENKKLNTQCTELKQNFEFKKIQIENMYQSKIRKLEKQISNLEKIIDKFKVTIKKFIKWICKKFEIPSEDDLIRKFQSETYTTLNIDKQLDYSQFKKDKNRNERI